MINISLEMTIPKIVLHIPASRVRKGGGMVIKEIILAISYSHKLD